MPSKITELHAWIATEADGSEGVCGMRLSNGSWIPLIGADADRIKSLRTAAEQVRRESGLPMKLVRFSDITVLEELP